MIHPRFRIRKCSKSNSQSFCPGSPFPILPPALPFGETPEMWNGLSWGRCTASLLMYWKRSQRVLIYPITIYGCSMRYKWNSVTLRQCHFCLRWWVFKDHAWNVLDGLMVTIDDWQPGLPSSASEVVHLSGNLEALYGSSLNIIY